MTEALKPCPFCGGNPFLKYGDGIVGISCPPDSACNKTGLCVAFLPEKEATAVAAWNRRALESRVLAERKCNPNCAYCKAFPAHPTPDDANGPAITADVHADAARYHYVRSVVALVGKHGEYDAAIDRAMQDKEPK